MRASIIKKESLLNIRGSKKTLTLIELFVCLGILAFIGSLLIIKAQPMIAHYRFESSAHRLAKELEWSHKVAMSACAEIDFTIEQRGNQLICKRRTDEPLGFGGGKQTFKIDHLPQFLFNDEEQNSLKLTFTRSGQILPQGTLVLRGPSQEESCSIALPPTEQGRIIVDKGASSH